MSVARTIWTVILGLGLLAGTFFVAQSVMDRGDAGDPESASPAAGASAPGSDAPAAKPSQLGKEASPAPRSSAADVAPSSEAGRAESSAGPREPVSRASAFGRIVDPSG